MPEKAKLINKSTIIEEPSIVQEGTPFFNSASLVRDKFRSKSKGETQKLTCLEHYQVMFEDLKRNPSNCFLLIKIILVYFKQGFFNTLNYSLNAFITRIATFFIAFVDSEENVIAVGYSKTIQNMIADFVLFSAAITISIEVGKCMGSHQLKKANKILYYSLLFNFGYTMLVYLPSIWFSPLFFLKYTKLNSDVAYLIRTVNIVCFIPALMANLNLCVSAYLQTLGLGNILGRCNFVGAILSFLAGMITFKLTKSGLYLFYAISWVITLAQFLASLSLYLLALKPEGKIKDIKINLKDWIFVTKSFLKNSIIGMSNSVDCELIMLFASIFLSYEANSAFIFCLSVSFMHLNVVLNHYKSTYAIFSNYLGMADVKMARFIFFLGSLLFLGSAVIYSLIFALGYKFMINNALKDSPKSQELLPTMLIITLIGQIARVHVCYPVDYGNGLEKRKLTFGLGWLKNFFLAGLCYYFVEILGIKGDGVTFAFYFPNFLMDLILHIIFYFTNWKRAIKRLKVLN